MLASCFSSNSAFDTIPDITNAVESHNRLSKGPSVDILKVAMMNTYKVDMAAALEHMAKCASILISYDNLSVASRAKRTAAANKARLRKRGGVMVHQIKEKIFENVLNNKYIINF